MSSGRPMSCGRVDLSQARSSRLLLILHLLIILLILLHLLLLILYRKFTLSVFFTIPHRPASSLSFLPHSLSFLSSPLSVNLIMVPSLCVSVIRHYNTFIEFVLHRASLFSLSSFTYCAFPLDNYINFMIYYVFLMPSLTSCQCRLLKMRLPCSR